MREDHVGVSARRNTTKSSVYLFLSLPLYYKTLLGIQIWYSKMLKPMLVILYIWKLGCYTQYVARKELEQCFGVLKSLFGIITIHARSPDTARCREIMYSCIIIHNMILKDRGKNICRHYNPDLPTKVEVTDEILLELCNSRIYQQLQADLINHFEHVYVPHLDN